MQCFESFGFAVELFTLSFCFICWLVTPSYPCPNHTEETGSSQVVAKIDDSQSNLIDKKINNSISWLEESLEEALEKLSLKDSRNAVKNLIAENIIEDDIPLKGKGCNKKYFTKILQRNLPQHRKAITEFMCSLHGEKA